ncbi:MAG: aspartyl protease family protein [Polaribacter sp.]
MYKYSIKNIFFVLILFYGCATSKSYKYLLLGNTIEKNFKSSFPFEYKSGFIVIKVGIDNKVFNFILDTGSSNVISKELATKLNVKPIDSENIYQGKRI